jgi:hypothetical protein
MTDVFACWAHFSPRHVEKMSKPSLKTSCSNLKFEKSVVKRGRIAGIRRCLVSFVQENPLRSLFAHDEGGGNDPLSQYGSRRYSAPGRECGVTVVGGVSRLAAGLPQTPTYS